MEAQKQIDQLLKDCGATYEGGKKHDRYKLPNGVWFTRPRTPSDARSPANSLSHLRKALNGWSKPEEPRVEPKKVEREKPERRGPCPNCNKLGEFRLWLTGQLRAEGSLTGEITAKPPEAVLSVARTAIEGLRQQTAELREQLRQAQAENLALKTLAAPAPPVVAVAPPSNNGLDTQLLDWIERHVGRMIHGDGKRLYGPTFREQIAQLLRAPKKKAAAR